MPGDAARRLLLNWLDRLIAGQAPEEVQLDLIEAAAARSEPEFRDRIKKYESTKPHDDPLSPFREVLSGGDREHGRRLFTSRADIECIRCHKVRASGSESTGGEVGPELVGVGARLSRTELLESIVNPNKKIADGFESVIIATGDGKVHTGILRGEDGKEVRLITAEGKPFAIPKDSIDDRKRGPSAMPADVAAKLSKKELRDLIEFLASLKTAHQTAAGRAVSEEAQPGFPATACCQFFLSGAASPAGFFSAPLSLSASFFALGFSSPLLLIVLFFMFSDVNLSCSWIAEESVPLYGTGPSSLDSPQPARAEASSTPAIPRQIRRIDSFLPSQTRKVSFPAD